MISRFTQLFVIMSMICPMFVNAKTLVISDIDDTIKATHLLNTTDTVVSQIPFMNEIEFGGMSAVYRLFQSQISKVKIYYVSNGLSFMGINSVPATFLAANNYPQAAHLSLRSSLDFYMNTKVERIVEIIKNEKPSQLILIGDNGEQDTEVYAKIRSLYPQIPALTFIHQVYSTRSYSETGKKLEAEQIGYVTSVDLAMELYSHGVIYENGIDWLMEQVMPSLLAENPISSLSNMGNLVFPEWLDCRDFKLGAWSQDTVLLQSLKNPNTQAYLPKLIDRLYAKCLL